MIFLAKDLLVYFSVISIFSQIVIWVDPLDGTAEFTQGQYFLLCPQFCMAGYIVSRTPVASTTVVHVQ